MTNHPPPDPETQFNLSAWLTLAFVILLIMYGFVSLAYRLTLPTDGWLVNEATEVGYNYTENLMGIPSGLQPGDVVLALNGIRAGDWDNLSAFQNAWQAGAVFDYTVIRDGQEMQVPVMLTHWNLGRWLQAKLHNPYELASYLANILLLALALFVFLRRPGNPTSAAFLLVIAILTEFLGAMLPYGWPDSVDPAARIFLMINNYFILGIVAFAFIRFALVFPHPKPILQRFPWLVWVPLAVSLLLGVTAFNSPINWFWLLFSLVLSIAILIHNAITMRDAVSRAQILWGVGGMLFGLGLISLILIINTSGLVPFNENAINLGSTIEVLGMGICLAIAITRYHLFDIEVIIRRTLVYGGLTLTLALIYFGSVLLLQNLFQALTGQGQSPLVIVISTLAIAALFNPLRKRIQNDIDKRFYRRKYDAEQTLEAFAASLRQEVDLEQICRSLLSVAEESMQPESLSLWIKPAAREYNSMSHKGSLR